MNKYVAPSLELVKFSPVSVIAASSNVEETTTPEETNAVLTPPTAGGTDSGSVDG